jgi:hypothetical protein
MSFSRLRHLEVRHLAAAIERHPDDEPEQSERVAALNDAGADGGCLGRNWKT